MAIQTVNSSDTFEEWRVKDNANFAELDLNAVAIHEVPDEAALLAAGANPKDIGIIASPTNKSFIHNGGVTGTMSDWVELLDVVQSVAGKVGIILLNGTDISNNPNGNIVSTNVQNAIDELDTEKASLAQAAAFAIALG